MLRVYFPLDFSMGACDLLFFTLYFVLARFFYIVRCATKQKNNRPTEPFAWLSAIAFIGACAGGRALFLTSLHSLPLPLSYYLSKDICRFVLIYELLSRFKPLNSGHIHYRNKSNVLVLGSVQTFQVYCYILVQLLFFFSSIHSFILQVLLLRFSFVVFCSATCLCGFHSIICLENKIYKENAKKHHIDGEKRRHQQTKKQQRRRWWKLRQRWQEEENKKLHREIIVSSQSIRE